MVFFPKEAEKNRQILADDARYLKEYLVYFELEVPAKLAGTGQTFLFPLALPPEGVEINEPFTTTVTPGQYGSLYVEESGIVQREIKLTGTMGFKPKRLGVVPTALSITSPENRSFSRELPGFVTAELSGQRHLHYLQDAVFRTYADLKKDPSTALETKLYIHIPNEQEHWRVIPRSFSVKKTTQRNFLWPYTIDLLAVEPARAEEIDFSEDRGLLARLKDTIASVRSFVRSVTGAIQNLTALVGEIQQYAQNISGFISDVGSVISAAADFVEGVVDLINVPYDIVKSLTDTAGSIVDSYERAKDAIKGVTFDDFDEFVKAQFRQIQGGFDQLGQHPEIFATDTTDQRATLKAQQETLLSTPASMITNASQPTSADEYRALGTGLTLGEVEAARGQIQTGRGAKEYAGAQPVVIQSGDTLASLAARYLGSATEWEAIALLNGLQPPFIDEIATVALDGADTIPFGGAVGVGAQILVPTVSPPPNARPTYGILGVPADRTAEERFLGRDFKLKQTANSSDASPQFDIPIDGDRGSVDVQTVVGVNNLKQAIRTRVTIERGSFALYKHVGLQRVVGVKNTSANQELLRFGIQVSVLSDPRIARIRKASFDSASASADTSPLNIDAEVRDLGANVSLQVPVR